MNDTQVLLSVSCFLFLKVKQLERKKRRRRLWQRTLFDKRIVYTEGRLIRDTTLKNIYIWMSASDFELLIQIVSPVVHKKDTNYRKAVSVKERLALTLRFLATGESFTSLMCLFKISKQLISYIVPEVCDAIVLGLQDEIKIPHSPEDWLKIEEQFRTRWNFDHCVGVLDGRHVMINAPINSRITYKNYKGTFSIILFVALDADYNFTFVDVGSHGSSSDREVFQNSVLKHCIDDGTLNLPKSSCPLGRDKPTPYVFVADNAFPISEHITKSHSELQNTKRIHKYRVERVRKVSENALGVLASIFRVFAKPMLLDPHKAKTITLTCVHLHNFLRHSSTSNFLYSPEGTFDIDDINSGSVIEGSWRSKIKNQSTFCSLQGIDDNLSSQLTKNQL